MHFFHDINLVSAKLGSVHMVEPNEVIPSKMFCKIPSSVAKRRRL
uniref:Uncharacterized protein n=1 Tax=Anguilla anguilla TaxID=7936 RepID=A0A0E9XG37_ANGAN